MRRQEILDRCALVVERLSAITWISFAARLVDHDVCEERDELGGVCRAAVLPSTSPVFVLKAAYKDSVPCRKYSNPWRSARPGDSAAAPSCDPGLGWRSSHPRRTRRHAPAGFRYSPMISAAFSLKVGIVRGHVALDPMRLELMLAPHPCHHHVGFTCRCAASLRVLQWVALPAGAWRVAPESGLQLRRAISPWRLVWRCRLWSPAIRCSANRRSSSPKPRLQSIRADTLSQ